ncbi:MAG: UMP kinase [Woeseiaceae bacterium]|jgi:uridylate kinase|tara:strand:+ start:546 stop:1268 length:723 start_codon:yes stop_codon:yes gene_type:complete
MKKSSPLYKRILVKLSGEALMGDLDYGIDPTVIKRIANELIQVKNLGIEVAVVVGGGNIFRGAGLAGAGMDRVTGDYMGMLATVMNALAIQDALESMDVNARVMSAIKIHEVCEDYIRRRAVRHLEKERIVLLAAGTGNPFFTTDSAASLRAIEIGAEVLLKATMVDGIYDVDPKNNNDAKQYKEISFDKVLLDKLNVMDATAIVMCRDNNLSLRIFNLLKPDTLVTAMTDMSVGTSVSV